MCAALCEGQLTGISASASASAVSKDFCKLLFFSKINYIVHLLKRCSATSHLIVRKFFAKYN
jgi:hypothetical protein